MSLIQLKNVSKVFGFSEATTVALREVDFQVKAGDFVALMGPSGSGKTTLLNIIGLLNNPTYGSYTFLNQRVLRMSQRKKAKVRGRKIGFIFQNFNLLSNLTILENVTLPLIYCSNFSFLKRERLAKSILNRLGLHRKEFLYPHQLSGGQIQRVAIARALINQPTILLADEPTGNLDSQNAQVVMEILSNLHQAGSTILMATHNPVLTKYANRIIYIEDGEIRIDQPLKAHQQADLGKMQDAVKKQSIRRRIKAKK